MSKNLEKILLGAGCFWGVEFYFRRLDGVISVVAGYSGGGTKNPTYPDICTGLTGHAEVVEVTYDPFRIRLEEILDLFWRLHDPTQVNRQGFDVGSQYRSCIFYYAAAQRAIIEKSMEKFNASGVFPEPAVTEVKEADIFYPAEECHQDYYNKNGGVVCHFPRDK